MNKKTLISFIGRGWIDKNHPERYLKAAYNFGENVICESRCFAEAIRKCCKFTFDRVIFIGSETSSWSVLLESLEETEFDLWSELYDNEIHKKTISPENKNKLQHIIQELWSVPVELAVYPSELLPENSNDILNHYVDSLLQCGNDILLDITHGFRWMPVLLASQLQFRSAYSADGSSGKVEIIYGELNTENGLSPVRQLDILVHGQENANAIALFFQKFEAEPLVKKLELHWPEGAKVIKRLGLYLQGNLFLPLLFDLAEENYPPSNVLNNLKNVCKDFNEIKQPGWVIKIRSELSTLHKKMTEGTPVDRLHILAELFAERKLYGQAILSICLAAEQSLLLAFGHKKHPGYDELKLIEEKFIPYKNRERYLCKNSKNSKMQELYLNIKSLRNLVAHGGMKTKEKPNASPEALSEQYKSVCRKLIELQEYWKTDFLLN